MVFISKQKGFHPEDIKAELRKQYGSLAVFGKKYHLTGQSISQALTKSCSARIEKLIAEALNHPPHAIWPDRWTKDGKPYFRRGEKAKAGKTRKNPSLKRNVA